MYISCYAAVETMESNPHPRIEKYFFLRKEEREIILAPCPHQFNHKTQKHATQKKLENVTHSAKLKEALIGIQLDTNAFAFATPKKIRRPRSSIRSPQLRGAPVLRRSFGAKNPNYLNLKLTV